MINLLREKNPFVSSVSPLPWDNINPDLAQLNRSAYEEIEQLIRHKRRMPNLPLAGLVLGKAGAGKTHMLSRILRRLRKTAAQAIFVAVKTFREPDSVIHHLLSEIFISLRRVHSKGRTQFDIIASEVMDVYREKRLNDGFSDTAKIDPKIYLARDIPNIDRNFLKCLLLYIGTSDEGVRSDILDWLCDGLDDNDSLRLGLPLKDTGSMSDARREQEAEKVLISLGLVLAYAKIPMIICFDQLDAMKDKALITAWGNIIALIMNDLSGILPLCFLRSKIWNDVFLPDLDEAVLQRLSNNIIHMDGCSVEQAKLLVRERINYAFSENENPTEIFNWLISRMNITPGMSPRSVIELANKAINDSDITTNEFFTVIRDSYNEEFKNIQDEPDNWPPNAEQITLALTFWLTSHDGISITKNDDKYFKFTALYDGKKFAFVICTTKNNLSVLAALKRGISFLNNCNDGICFYISEEKTHKKTWNNANKILQDFKKANGRAIFLDKNTRVKFYALTALINRIDNGDVNLYTSTGMRTATCDDAKIFVKSIPLIEFPFSTQTPTTPTPQPAPTYTPTPAPAPVPTSTDNNDALLRELLKITNSSPMKIITVKRL